MRNTRTGSSNFFLFIVLIALILYFHMELYILGVRIYAAITHSPQAENILGNYYQITAQRNKAYSESSYAKALSEANKKLESSEDPKQKAELNLDLGRNYECGRGTTVDLAKAKTFYDQAKQANANDDALNTKITEAQNRINEKLKNPNDNQNCMTESDISSLKPFGFIEKFMPRSSSSSDENKTNEKPMNDKSMNEKPMNEKPMNEKSTNEKSPNTQ